MRYHVEHQGNLFTVYYSDEVIEFLESPEVPLKDKANLGVTWKKVGSLPNYRQRDKFVHEEGKIFAAKAYQVRVYGWFTDDKRFVCGCACIKKRDKADPAMLRRAETLRQEYEDARKKGVV